MEYLNSASPSGADHENLNLFKILNLKNNDQLKIGRQLVENQRTVGGKITSDAGSATTKQLFRIN